MFSDLLFFRSPVAPVPTASKHPAGLGFPTGDMGTEGWQSHIKKSPPWPPIKQKKEKAGGKNRICHCSATGPLLFLGGS